MQIFRMIAPDQQAVVGITEQRLERIDDANGFQHSLQGVAVPTQHVVTCARCLAFAFSAGSVTARDRGGEDLY